MIICLQIIVPKTFIIEQIIKKKNRLQLHHEFTIKPIKTNKSKKILLLFNLGYSFIFYLYSDHF